MSHALLHSLYSSIHTYNTRQKSNLHIEYTRTTCRQNTVRMLGPRLWNIFPTEVKSAPVLAVFNQPSTSTRRGRGRGGRNNQTRQPGRSSKMPARYLDWTLDHYFSCANQFCFLLFIGFIEAEEASRTRVRSAWGKFNELAPVLTKRGVSLKLKGKIYDACVQRVLVYGSETWAIKAEDLARLRRAERMMVRRMCGVSLKDRKRSDELLNRLGIECVENKIQRGRLRWFGHVERKEENNWVKKCTRMNVIGVVDRGAPRKTWRSCVKRDMKAMGIKEEMAQDRCAWRNITGGPTRASADAWNTVCVLGSRTLNEYDDDDDDSCLFISIWL